MRPTFFHFVIILSAVLSFASCVSTGKFNAVQQEKQKYDSLYTWSIHTLKTCQDDNNALTSQKGLLQDQANDLNLQMNATKENNIQLRKQLQDLSALSSTQAESIRKSLDNIGAKDDYIRELRSAVAQRDSVNLAVLLDLKATLGSLGDQDITIKTEKSVVYVDISDRLLFNSDSNSYTLTDKGKSFLGRLARVFNDQPDIEFRVEGQTDSIPSPREVLVDNWDLGVKRATSIVRILQNDYNISPVRMTAAGRSACRRTRIVILPKLDLLLELLERGQGHAG